MQKEVSDRAARIAEIHKLLPKARDHQQSLLQYAMIKDQQSAQLESASEATRYRQP